MLLYQLVTFAYVFDYFYYEKKMTSTWDIVAENFGLMLVWGDFVFIPFFFSLQCFYLLEHSPSLSLYFQGVSSRPFLEHDTQRAACSSTITFSPPNKNMLEKRPLNTIGLCVIVFIVGYIIFRGANSQKDQFKNTGMKV